MNKQILICLVGKKNAGRTFVAWHLQTKHSFKNMRLDDGVVKFLRDMYKYRSHQRIVWEERLRFYDALYQLDPEIHIDYLLRRLETTTRNVIVDDVRYVNEVQKLIAAGFVVVRIEAPESRYRKLRDMDSAAPCLVKINEYFGKGIYDDRPVDFSVYNDTRDSTRASIDKIVARLGDRDVHVDVDLRALQASEYR